MNWDDLSVATDDYMLLYMSNLDYVNLFQSGLNLVTCSKSITHVYLLFTLLMKEARTKLVSVRERIVVCYGRKELKMKE